MWPGFKSWHWHHMWVEFCWFSPLICSVRFFYWYSGFPCSSKTNISKFQLSLECTDMFKGQFSRTPTCKCFVGKQITIFFQLILSWCPPNAIHLIPSLLSVEWRTVCTSHQTLSQESSRETCHWCSRQWRSLHQARSRTSLHESHTT